MAYSIKAEWDAKAGVWVASSDDVPGLATGADTFEELIEKLRVVRYPSCWKRTASSISSSDEIPFAVFAERLEHAPARCAGLPKAF